MLDSPRPSSCIEEDALTRDDEELFWIPESPLSDPHPFHTAANRDAVELLKELDRQAENLCDRSDVLAAEIEKRMVSLAWRLKRVEDFLGLDRNMR